MNSENSNNEHDRPNDDMARGRKRSRNSPARLLLLLIDALFAYYGIIQNDIVLIIVAVVVALFIFAT